jgi:hypothetical protein
VLPKIIYEMNVSGTGFCTAGKVTQSTDTRRPRGCLSAGSLACTSRPAHSRKGGEKDPGPRLGSRYASLRLVGVDDTGTLMDASLQSRPGREMRRVRT